MLLGLTFPFVVTNEGECAICYITPTQRTDGAGAESGHSASLLISWGGGVEDR